MTYTIDPIGIIHTCFPEKFGIPRQPLLAPSAKGILELHAPYNDPDCVAGLEHVSHLWLSFVFHQHVDKGWKPKVRPPRLGGNQKVGVFATRSSFRPNHLGLSVVKLDAISLEKNTVRLHLSGVDLLDGTPIIDIKPYVPYADSIDGAKHAFADSTPVQLPVVFSENASIFCDEYQQKTDECLRTLIVEVLQQNPRPAYHNKKTSDKEYGMILLHYNVRWRYLAPPSQDGNGADLDTILVTMIE